jgi:hypothetical protein
MKDIGSTLVCAYDIGKLATVLYQPLACHRHAVVEYKHFWIHRPRRLNYFNYYSINKALFLNK